MNSPVIRSVWPLQGGNANEVVRKPNNFFHQVSYDRLQVSVPEIEGAEYVNDDELCLMCHQAYTDTMQHNVHRGIHEGQTCEACHGPATGIDITGTRIQ